MRLIDADAFANFIKNAIKTQRCDALKVNDAALSVGDVLESVVAELEGTSLDGFKNNPTIEPQPQWIPVTERLPEKVGKYLVSVRNGNVYAGVYDSYSGRFQCDALAWMPLPEPYKGNER